MSAPPSKPLNRQIEVVVRSYYVEERIEKGDTHFVFGYQITIVNQAETSVQLLSRQWLLTDGNGNKSEVQGQGVVGKQPLIAPGQEFQYSSGTIFKTPVGTMEGSYLMTTIDGQQFTVNIPPFRLALPHIIN